MFDRVFGSEVTQEGVWEYLSESVNAFTQGYNVSVLAYGQSGAGKSYTMGTSGPDEQADLDVMGMHQPFQIAQNCDSILENRILTLLIRCHPTRSKCSF